MFILSNHGNQVATTLHLLFQLLKTTLRCVWKLCRLFIKWILNRSGAAFSQEHCHLRLFLQDTRDIQSHQKYLQGHQKAIKGLFQQYQGNHLQHLSGRQQHPLSHHWTLQGHLQACRSHPRDLLILPKIFAKLSKTPPAANLHKICLNPPSLFMCFNK